MAKPLSFQQVILKLHEYWSDQGCVIWEPYNVQVGAGTGNPATLLRVLGPEPWRVAYVEPSVRPDDGRFGENPNRMQKYYQYQVVLKPDPGNPQELYLQSLEALGINPREHDIRFVEDNWESPALGAWGLGWEVWLDGQEITQFTYFQQAGGLELNPVSVEITYGIERIVLALQGKESAWEIDWMDGGLTYADLMLQEEIEHCRYYFNVADVDALKLIYDSYEHEYYRALEGDALISAYDYVLKCSHLFNVLDTRGAIGVTERASYFRRMRDMTRTIARSYAEQREAMGHPLMRLQAKWDTAVLAELSESAARQQVPDSPADVLLEIGIEELPADDVTLAAAQLREAGAKLFDDLRLEHGPIHVYATPRRLIIHAKDVAPRQPDMETVEKGPPAARAFDAEGNPTKAAAGFARSRGVDVEALRVEEIDGGEYVVATVFMQGRYTIEVLNEAFSELIANIKFGKSMRWNQTGIAFSRPIRWILALFGGAVIPFEFAGVVSGNVTRGLRPYGSLPQVVGSPLDYFDTMGKQNIHLDIGERREAIIEQINRLADEIGGRIPHNPGLLEEVVNLVEAPTAMRGKFSEDYLVLPRDVLVTVMRKHQRYFPVEDASGQLMPYFIAVRNGDDKHLDKVIAGNEAVLRARFSDANFFYQEDIKKPLKDYLARLGTLTFEEKLGSMLDKNQRVAGMVKALGELIGMEATEIAIAERAAHIAKADLATHMVVEMTSLQGVIGREYALLQGHPPEVANTIYEHWQPRNADDTIPASDPGTLLALSDRLDSLVGLFASGHAPRSTADPYGLRRAALGLIQILTEKELPLVLIQALDLVATTQPIPVEAHVKAQILEFIAGRLRVWMQEQGFATDVINAVLAQQTGNPYSALVGVQELTGWVARDDWEVILDSFARCVRITRAEVTTYRIDEALFQQEEEHALFAAYELAAVKLGAEVHGGNGNVGDFLACFEPMVPAVTAFFDGVLVNAEDESIKNNRLALLQAISAMQLGRADLSELANF